MLVVEWQQADPVFARLLVLSMLEGHEISDAPAGPIALHGISVPVLCPS
jgi:hypothetical protein